MHEVRIGRIGRYEDRPDICDATFSRLRLARGAALLVAPERTEIGLLQVIDRIAIDQESSASVVDKEIVSNLHTVEVPLHEQPITPFLINSSTPGMIAIVVNRAVLYHARNRYAPLALTGGEQTRGGKEIPRRLLFMIMQ